MSKFSRPSLQILNLGSKTCRAHVFLPDGDGPAPAELDTRAVTRLEPDGRWRWAFLSVYNEWVSKVRFFTHGDGNNYMKAWLLDYLICPESKKPLEQEKDFLRVPGLERSYPILNGVPQLFTESLGEDDEQVYVSFTDKWKRVPNFGFDEASRDFYRNWYLKRYHWESEAKFFEFLNGKKSIFDAGCGLGRDLAWYSDAGIPHVVGLDISDSTYSVANRFRDRSNVAVVRGDITKMPILPESFDFVVSDQVLTNLSDPKAAFHNLVKCVKPGGHLAFYVYRKKAPLREFADDHIRQSLTRLDPSEAWQICESITKLGRSLSELQIEFEILEDIPLLGIKAGRYDIQRFIYYHMLKCYWNKDIDFEINNATNFDWYHPAYTFRYTPDEIKGWISETELEIMEFDDDDPSGLSILALKHA